MLNVFSNADLERLAAGKCLLSNRRANRHIADDLTSKPDFRRSVEEWFSCASRHGDRIADNYRRLLRSNVSSYRRFNQTIGEIMAAYFLERQQGFSVSYVDCRSDKRTPDLEANKDGSALTVEVKTAVGGLSPGVERYYGAGPNVKPKLEKFIKKASGQLNKNDEQQNLLLIVDWWKPHITRKEALDVLYGQIAIRMTWAGPNGPFLNEAHLSRKNDGRCKPEFNTRLGAVGLLRWSGSAECKAYFVHNAYASKPLPSVLLDPWPQLVRSEDGTEMVWCNKD